MKTINQSIFTTKTSHRTVIAITVCCHENSMLGIVCICTARRHTVFTISRIRSKIVRAEI